MILKDGTDTKEEYSRPGPFCDGMSVVLDRLYGEADDTASNEGNGSGAARFGRRIFRWDSCGFMWTDRYKTVHEAESDMDEFYSDEIELPE